MSKSAAEEHKPIWVAVDFETADVYTDPRTGALMLKVTGSTPSSSSLGCPVKLSPVQYVKQPEYWKIEVLWDRADAIFQSLCPFSVSIPLNGIRGKKGIDVVGRSHSKEIEC